jgi:hypothetical protein
MTPEQASGGAQGPRSDIYSPGVILYPMPGARVPFERSDGSVWPVLEDHQCNSPPTIPNVSLPVPEMVSRSLAKDSGSRYRRAEELGAALGGANNHINRGF